MAQRIFDTQNEKDMQDLWDILPYNINRVMRYTDKTYKFFEDEIFVFECSWLRINWHDKTEEIVRPMLEATEADLEKWCCFWNNCWEDIIIGKLTVVDRDKGRTYYKLNNYAFFNHCRRLTKQEIEGLCQ